MMTRWGVVYIGIVLCCYKGVQCTVCSEAAALENIEVIRMCQSGSITAQRVVIDTFDTGDPYVYGCSCIARPIERSSDSVSFERSFKVDQKIPCGSVLSLQTSKEDSISFECVWPDKIYRKEWSSFDATLSRTTSKEPWQYGYCILLDTGSIEWNVTCLPPAKYTTSAPILTTVATTSAPSSTAKIKTTTTTTTTSTLSSSSVAPTSSSNTPDISIQLNCSTQKIEVFSTATVVVPIVIVVLIAAVTTIANVILYRRRLALDQKPTKNPDNALQPTGSIVYDSIDVSRLEPLHTYADTTAGRMYANTASGTAAGRMYTNTATGSAVGGMYENASFDTTVSKS